MEPRLPSKLKRIVVAILLVALSLAITKLVPALAQRGSLVALLAGVVVATWFGGTLSSTVAILFAVPLGYYVLRGAHTRPLVIDTVEDLHRLGFFVFICVVLYVLQVWRERANGLARRAEQRLRLALETFHMGAWEFENQSGQLWASTSLHTIFGRGPEQFASTLKDFLEYVHADDRSAFERALMRTIEDGLDFEIEHRVVRADGQIRWIVTRGRLFYNRSDQADRVIGIATDVTERRRQAAAVPAARESA